MQMYAVTTLTFFLFFLKTNTDLVGVGASEVVKGNLTARYSYAATTRGSLLIFGFDYVCFAVI